MPEVNRGQWYVRWFFWSRGILDEFWDTDSAYQYRDGINLCPMMRTMLIWAPLVLALHVLVYGMALVALTIVPILFYGWHGYVAILEAVAIAALLIAFAVLLVKGVDALVSWRRKYRREHPKASPKPRPVEMKAVPVKPPKGPGFFAILWRYIEAIHDGICPYISFKKENVQ